MSTLGRNMGDRMKLRKYWLDQVRSGRGPGMVYYRGSRLQRGSGLASILGSIVRSPLVKKGLAYAAKAALNTGGDIISNLASGQDFKSAAKAGFNRQKAIQKKKAVNVIKALVRPKMRQPAKKRFKSRRRRFKRADNFGALSR